MARLHLLKAMVNQRLTAAAEEIFGVFERTITQYEEELHRQRDMLDMKFLRAGVPQLSASEEDVPPEQQERSPSLDLEEPEPLQIKEELEDFWISQEEEQLQGLEEAAIIKLTSTHVPVKSENDEENPQSSRFNQTQTEPLASTSAEQMLKTETHGFQLLSSDCSGMETEDSDTSGLNTLKSKKTRKVKGQHSSTSSKFKTAMEPSHERKSELCCKLCGVSFGHQRNLMCHIHVHLDGCGLCGKHLESKDSLNLHLQDHRTCKICGKVFTRMYGFARHARTHTGEKPFTCSVCGKRFRQREYLRTHMKTHTSEMFRFPTL